MQSRPDVYDLQQSLRHFSPELLHALDPSLTMPTMPNERLALLVQLFNRVNEKPFDTRTIAEIFLGYKHLFPVLRDPTNPQIARATCTIAYTNSFAYAQTLLYLQQNPLLPSEFSAEAQFAVRSYVDEVLGGVGGVHRRLVGGAQEMRRGVTLSWMHHSAYVLANRECPFVPIPADAFPPEANYGDCGTMMRIEMEYIVKALEAIHNKYLRSKNM